MRGKVWKMVHVACSFMVWPIKSQKLKCGMPEACGMDILQVRLNIGMLFLEIMCISYHTSHIPQQLSARMSRQPWGDEDPGSPTLLVSPLFHSLDYSKTKQRAQVSYVYMRYVWLQYDIHIIEYIYIYTLYFVEFVIGFCHVIDQCFWIFKPWPV